MPKSIVCQKKYVPPNVRRWVFKYVFKYVLKKPPPVERFLSKSLELFLGDDAFGDVFGHFGIVAEFHGITGAALGHRTKLRGITEHIG